MMDDSENFEPQSGFPIWETHLAGAVGLTKDVVRAIRKKGLRGGVHYITHKRRICYSPAGEAELRRLLKLPDQPADKAAPPGDIAEDPAAIKAPAQKDAPASPPSELIAWRAASGNHQIVEAHIEGRDPADPKNRLRVRVRDNTNFTRGMKIPVKPLGDGLYAINGNLPRWRGKY